MADQLKYVFLFGHRKQHGKDTSVSLFTSMLADMGVSVKSDFFARKLKEQACDKYGLDFDKMGDDAYKNSKPPHLNGLTVRDVLIKEGCGARAIWQNVWAFPVYKNLLNSGAKVGLVSDFRYPNECACFEECFDIVNANNTYIKPTIIKVLVHKPDGKFVSDGADDQLPDVDPYWDFVIMNDDKTDNWKQNIERQLKNMVESIIGV
jgi:hypothetical protein